MQTLERSKSILQILIAEDDAPTRDLLGAIIARKFPDIAICLVDNGREGVKMFKQLAPKIVITDIKMPEMDGIEMADQIKSICPDTKFIVLTAFNSKFYFTKFKDIGFNAYVTKPIEFPKLFDAINKCIAEVE